MKKKRYKLPSHVAKDNTARIVTGGEVRLSANLISEPVMLWPAIDAVGKIVFLYFKQTEGLAGQGKWVYFSNPRARSGRISLIRELKFMFPDVAKIKGKVYSAVKEDNWIAIDFRKSLRGVKQ